MTNIITCSFHYKLQKCVREHQGKGSLVISPINLLILFENIQKTPVPSHVFLVFFHQYTNMDLYKC